MSKSLVLGIAGAALGFLIGGPFGATIGWFLGSTVGSLLSLEDQSSTTYGPRITDFKTLSSKYGIPIARGYGTVRLAGNVIFAGPVIEIAEEVTECIETEGIFGIGSQTTCQTLVTYHYFQTAAIAFAEGPADRIMRLWADGNLIYSDGTSTSDTPVVPIQTRPDLNPFAFAGEIPINFYTGTPDQAVDPAVAFFSSPEFNLTGEQETIPFRNIVYVALQNILLDQFSYRIPAITAEVAFTGTLSLSQALKAPLPTYGGLEPPDAVSLGIVVREPRTLVALTGTLLDIGRYLADTTTGAVIVDAGGGYEDNNVPNFVIVDPSYQSVRAQTVGTSSYVGVFDFVSGAQYYWVGFDTLDAARVEYMTYNPQTNGFVASLGTGGVITLPSSGVVTDSGSGTGEVGGFVGGEYLTEGIAPGPVVRVGDDARIRYALPTNGGTSREVHLTPDGSIWWLTDAGTRVDVHRLAPNGLLTSWQITDADATPLTSATHWTYFTDTDRFVIQVPSGQSTPSGLYAVPRLAFSDAVSTVALPVATTGGSSVSTGASWQATAPVISSPANGATLTGPTVTVAFSDSPTGRQYIVKIIRAATVHSESFVRTGPGSSPVTLGVPEDGSALTVEVHYSDNSGTSYSIVSVAVTAAASESDGGAPPGAWTAYDGSPVISVDNGYHVQTGTLSDAARTALSGTAKEIRFSWEGDTTVAYVQVTTTSGATRFIGIGDTLHAGYSAPNGGFAHLETDLSDPKIIAVDLAAVLLRETGETLASLRTLDVRGDARIGLIETGAGFTLTHLVPKVTVASTGPTVSGTTTGVLTGTRVTVTWSGGLVLTSTTATNGSWSVTPSNPSSLSGQTVTASVTGTSGTVATTSPVNYTEGGTSTAPHPNWPATSSRINPPFDTRVGQSEPAVGVVLTESNGVRLQRINRASDAPFELTTHVYSQLPATFRNGAYMDISASSYRYSDFARVATFPIGSARVVAWQTDHVYGFEHQSTRFMRVNSDGTGSTLLRDFAGAGIGSAPTIGNGQGTLSENDRYVALVGGGNVLVYDIVADSIVGGPIGILPNYDWATVTLDGQYVVQETNVGSTRRWWRYNRNLSLSSRMLLRDYSEHNCFVKDAVGDEWIISTEGNNFLGVRTRDAARLVFTEGAFGHVSGCMIDRPGWFGFTLNSGPVGAGYVEIDTSVAPVSRSMSVDGYTTNYLEYRAKEKYSTWTRHRSTHGGYLTQARGSVYRDGSRMVFASDWYGTRTPVSYLVTFS